MGSLGDRMKQNYEDRSKTYLLRRMPVIIRLDGKSFHTLTKGCKKPFDEDLRTCMINTMGVLCRKIQGVVFGYQQSDEISLLLVDYENLNTEAWFNYSVQKICSVSAAIASVEFSKNFNNIFNTGYDWYDCYFDSRCFNMPKEEVCNYFIWRQKDWERNSVAMLAQAKFSVKELYKKGKSDMHEMLWQKGVNWADLEDCWKNGTYVFENGVSTSSCGDIVGVRSEWWFSSKEIFTEKRELIEQFVFLEEGKKKGCMN